MATHSLDIVQRQCLIDFFDDGDGLRWHARVLVHQSPHGDGKWVGFTPNLEAQIVDLSEHRVVALGRNRPLPADRLHETYAFEELRYVELQAALGECRALAEMVGYLKPVGPSTDGG